MWEGVEMERLVYFTGDIALVDNLSIEDCMAIQEPLKKLHDYEIAEEQGLLLRLPCKVGDMLYVLVDMNEEGKYTRWKGDFVKSIYLNPDNEWMIEFTYVWHDRRLFEIGKSVFLTKEEAEQKLKELKGK